MPQESVFSVNPNPVKFGEHALREIGSDARQLGMRRIALFTDRWVAQLPFMQTVLSSLQAAQLDVVVYDEVAVEPTDSSFMTAATFAREGQFDGYISLGGGSVIDTAKAANLYATYPAELMTYVNAPVGKAQPVPGPLKPHIACPTTSGTGSECTGIAIFDLQESHIKTGIASPYLKPTLGIIDPVTTYSLPPLVIASTGVDVLVHALESYTALPYSQRPAALSSAKRPPAQGANPHSDIGALEALRLGGRYLERAVNDPADKEARHQLMWSATLAGIAFGNAGVHIPHAMSYAVASLKKAYLPADYPTRKKLVPHGISVIVNAPAAIHFCYDSNPEKHWQAAIALGAEFADDDRQHGAHYLADRIIQLMKNTGIPNGIAALGYEAEDIEQLAKGAFSQQRLLNNAPREVSEASLQSLFRDAMSYW